MNTTNRKKAKRLKLFENDNDEARFLAAARLNAIRQGVRWKDSYQRTDQFPSR